MTERLRPFPMAGRPPSRVLGLKAGPWVRDRLMPMPRPTPLSRSSECGSDDDRDTRRERGSKLDVQTVSKVFRRDGRIVRALDPVSVTIPEGRLISLIGPSGCGKSTLFNIIAGLLRPT